MIPQNTILARKDCYGTPTDRAVSILPPTLTFYLRMIAIVMKSSRKARRGGYTDRDWINSSIDIINSLENARCRFDIRGMDVLSRLNEAVVFISNHMSTLETFVLPSLIHPIRPCTFVIKPSLMDYPVFGHVMRSRNPIVVSRDNARQDLATVMEEGARRIGKGTSVILFPQTTRTRVLDPSNFNSLGIKLARAAKAQVVPIALKTDAWDNGRLAKDFGRIHPNRTVHIRFGEPLSVEGSGREQHQIVVDFVRDHLDQWHAEAAV
jgi:1-acyl-sn-glycerol-3-phosphate acyltransferase